MKCASKRELEPNIRVKSFDEVIVGLSAEELMAEAERCLNCPRKPCSVACPINNDIPEFIKAAGAGDFEQAFQIIRRKSSLPGVCGRVCPQEKQCEGSCTRGIKGEPIAIGLIERFVSDWADRSGVGGNLKVEEAADLACDLKVAVVGSGPAGIGAADVLSAAGAKVTMFEKRAELGGVLKYGIPEYRLPKVVIDQKFAELAAQGVEFRVGVDAAERAEELLKFDAVFLGNGAEIAKTAQLPGEGGENVLRALEFLESVSKDSEREKMRAAVEGQRVVVIGGGNVAMDVAATSTRLGAKSVTITYRRSLEELPARAEEVRMNEEEGVEFRLLSSPVEIREGCLIAQKVELGKPDESGRCAPVCQIGSEFEIPADVVIIAIGSDCDTSVASALNVEVDEKGRAKVNEQFQTSNPKVWAGGDCVTGPKTVVAAMAAGRTAAAGILGS